MAKTVAMVYYQIACVEISISIREQISIIYAIPLIARSTFLSEDCLYLTLSRLDMCVCVYVCSHTLSFEYLPPSTLMLRWYYLQVRWADLEEEKEQNRRRDLGFVVGQTKEDWERITDSQFAEKALNKTKYI